MRWSFEIKGVRDLVDLVEEDAGAAEIAAFLTSLVDLIKSSSWWQSEVGECAELGSLVEDMECEIGEPRYLDMDAAQDYLERLYDIADIEGAWIE